MGWRGSQCDADSWWRNTGEQRGQVATKKATEVIGMSGLAGQMQNVSWSDKELKALMVANLLQSSTVAAGGSRQVVAACASAAINTIIQVERSDTSGSHTAMEAEKADMEVRTKPDSLEYLLQEVLITSQCGGVGTLRKRLVEANRNDLAWRLSGLNKARRASAHPDIALLQEVLLALGGGGEESDAEPGGGCNAELGEG